MVMDDDEEIWIYGLFCKKNCIEDLMEKMKAEEKKTERFLYLGYLALCLLSHQVPLLIFVYKKMLFLITNG